MIRPHAHPVPAEVRTRNVPAEIEPATQNEASLLGRIQTARMLASTIDDKSRRVIGNHLGMTASQIEREVAWFEEIKSGRHVPEISPDQLRSILGGGA